MSRDLRSRASCPISAAARASAASSRSREHDVRAELDEERRGGQADARRGAGDERDAAARAASSAVCLLRAWPARGSSTRRRRGRRGRRGAVGADALGAPRSRRSCARRCRRRSRRPSSSCRRATMPTLGKRTTRGHGSSFVTSRTCRPSSTMPPRSSCRSGARTRESRRRVARRERDAIVVLRARDEERRRLRPDHVIGRGAAALRELRGASVARGTRGSDRSSGARRSVRAPAARRRPPRARPGRRRGRASLQSSRVEPSIAACRRRSLA